jgi:hypothetical protein
MATPTRWIIGYRKGTQPSKDELARQGLQVVDQHAHEDGVNVLVEAVGAAAERSLAALRSHPAVAYVEPDQTVEGRKGP